MNYQNIVTFLLIAFAVLTRIFPHPANMTPVTGIALFSAMTFNNKRLAFMIPLMCMFLSDNDEMLFVIDEKQNIYERNNNWVDNMKGTKFRGRWRTLTKSYRMPYQIATKAQYFSEQYLPELGAKIEPNNETGNLFEPKLEWNNILNENQISDLVISKYKELTVVYGEHPSDIVILVPDHKTGIYFVGIFEHRLNVMSNHIFDLNGKDSFKNKRSFYMGDSRLKICTIHSFKGWELKNLVIVIPKIADDINKLDKLVYTSITRSLAYLSIINLNPRYIDFGNSWSS